MENPYLVDNSIRLKVVLSCPKEAVWNLIGTCEGYVTWFPTSCTGIFEKGKTIQCGWWGSEPDEEHRILEIKKGHYVEMDWDAVAQGAKVRYSIESENPVVFSLEATYPKTSEGEDAQLLDIAPWTFALMNLKSVVMGGIDLRNLAFPNSSSDAFID